jgi:deazaflavin-dependent oxidoreductase (nitroreductase family)
MSVRDRFLWTLKHTLNRLTTRIARSRVCPFALVRHVGRRSGRPYQTPLILARVPAGFVAELTYGPDVDWYKYITAAGGCTVLHHGREYEIRRDRGRPGGAGARGLPGPGPGGPAQSRAPRVPPAVGRGRRAPAVRGSP